MNAFKEVAEIIGWLAGAVAAFSGVVYVAGYLIVQTTRHLLGFDALLTYSADFYLQKGGGFLLLVWRRERWSDISKRWIVGMWKLSCQSLGCRCWSWQEAVTSLCSRTHSNA